MVSSSLAEAFDQSDAVAIARVLSSEVHDWKYAGRRESCGYTVRIEIETVYSGPYEGVLEIGSSTSLTPNMTYLLFLDRRSEFVGTDVRMVNEGAALLAEKACLSDIPELKANWRYTSEVSRKFVVLGPLLNPYLELTQDAYKVKRSWRVEERGLDTDELVLANLAGDLEAIST